MVEARDAEVGLLKLMVQKLKLQLARRDRALFGSSSERFEDGQGSLIEPAPLDEIAAPKPACKQVSPPPTPRSTAACRRTCRATSRSIARRPQPHITTTIGQACGCTACGGRLRRIGADVSEQLEYVPSHFKVIRHVRPKLACVKCQSIFQADAPSRPIVRGIAGPGLHGACDGLEIL